ncbi:MAG: FG-GAP repeat domain-containing protein [Phycisphaerales bacterium]
MDINGDGHLDILSGSYSRPGQDMAGLFQVLAGKPGGGFSAATPLNGDDGQPLVIGSSTQKPVGQICTRPFAVDLDADGLLDIVAGNFGGEFHMFRGTGPGTFAARSTMLVAAKADANNGRARRGPSFDGPTAKKASLAVPMHSDPFLIDWDGDGDHDMLSGTARGGVMIAMNTGTPQAPSFAAFRDLVAAPAKAHAMPTDDITLGESHLTGPAGSTRVWSADVDDDGDLDLLVGDTQVVYHAGEGVTVAQAKAAMATFSAAQQKLFVAQPMPKGDDAGSMATYEREMAEWQKKYEALIAERDKTVREERTGFVWMYERR